MPVIPAIHAADPGAGIFQKNPVLRGDLVQDVQRCGKILFCLHFKQMFFKKIIIQTYFN